MRGTIEDVIQESEEGFEAILDGRDVAVLEDEAIAGAKRNEDRTDDEDMDAASVKKKTKEDTDSQDDTNMEDEHA